MLYSCDKYTREFYELNGVPQIENQKGPTDEFEKKANKPYFKPNYNRKAELEKTVLKS